LGPEPSSIGNSVRGRIRTLDYFGSSIRYMVDTSAGVFVIRVARAPALTTFEPGHAVFVTWRLQDATVFK